LYFADDNRIRRISATGDVSTIATNGGSLTISAAGLAIDSAMNIFIANSKSHIVQALESSGSFVTIAGLAGEYGDSDGGAAARFRSLSGIAVDSAGQMFVTDSHRVRLVTRSGLVTTIAGSPEVLESGYADGTGSQARFNFPQGIAIGPSGELYVADEYNHAIRKVSSNGVVTTVAGLGGDHGFSDGSGSTARFFGPQGVAVDAAGNVYVADSSNCSIRVIAPSGIVSTIAGRQWASDTVDGPGSLAQFAGPSKICVNRSGHLFVTERSSFTIRKIAW
jgi:sugar lactone lactonase YvrE